MNHELLSAGRTKAQEKTSTYIDKLHSLIETTALYKTRLSGHVLDSTKSTSKLHRPTVAIPSKEPQLASSWSGCYK